MMLLIHTCVINVPSLMEIGNLPNKHLINYLIKKQSNDKL
jgi:hypothetical protein